MSGRYTPTMGMVVELANVRLGLPCANEAARQRCLRRGLLTLHGLSGEGLDALRHAGQQFEAHHG